MLIKFILELNCDNAAFEDSPAEEITSVFKEASRRASRAFDEVINLPNGEHDLGKFLDSNGNSCGSLLLVIEEEDWRKKVVELGVEEAHVRECFDDVEAAEVTNMGDVWLRPVDQDGHWLSDVELRDLVRYVVELRSI